jgi:hypothetical protein
MALRVALIVIGYYVALLAVGGLAMLAATVWGPAD